MRLDELDAEQWEAICQCCGACCFEKKIDSRGVVRTLAAPCRFLDIHTRNCRIYHQRLQAEEDCIKLTPEILPTLAWLPKNCAYRKLLGDDDQRK
ncbi:MAG: hypothetical protein GQ578_05175 [Desulfuromonadaceae bacterium]|nr:hypothetical protein [Desulfuromonadaceae bacterium]